MLSFLTTPLFISASFLLKAKSSSHLFSGVLAWPKTCGALGPFQSSHLCQTLKRAADQRTDKKWVNQLTFVDFNLSNIRFRLWPYQTCGWGDVGPRGTLLAAVLSNHPSTVECPLGNNQFEPRGWGWHPDEERAPYSNLLQVKISVTISPQEVSVVSFHYISSPGFVCFLNALQYFPSSEAVIGQAAKLVLKSRAPCLFMDQKIHQHSLEGREVV